MFDLFTYGSLMCQDIFYKVAGCSAEFTSGTLEGYYRSKIHQEEYPGIIPQPGSLVEGVLYTHITSEALDRLDAFEGEYYERQQVEILSQKFGKSMAMTYIIKPRYHAIISFEEWSYADFLLVGKKKFEKMYLGFARI